MSVNATVRAPFGDGVYDFRLGIKELVEHDRLCDAGPEYVLNALYGGTWRVPYIRETIRLGLIGGGKDPMSALALVDVYADAGHLGPLKALAANIIAAAFLGAPEEGDGDPPGEPTGESRPSPEGA